MEATDPKEVARTEMKQTEQQSSGRNQDSSNQRLSKEHFASMMELSGSQKLQTQLKVLQSIQITSSVILINGYKWKISQLLEAGLHPCLR